jgi:hypothetical protein
MDSLYEKDALITRYRDNREDYDAELLERVNRILGPQGITPKFDTVEPKGGLGGENQKPKPKPEKQTDPVKVTTIEEVEALTAGTSYITPSGIINTR